ncbi:hypothetical protein NKR23_g12549 [Pleurostoma richardsiae]|uniref:Uncharacterized protein n=1 Tax=Pleurostoma richardsiae TaxID=41990 RepID=A0AA38RDQ4_9PEZI|nr:hypothetical protein NKR23_g12549 [Pleurostoma richardsiae]
MDHAKAQGKEKHAGLKSGVRKRQNDEAQAKLRALQAAYEKDSSSEIKEQLDAIQQQIDQDEMDIDNDEADPGEANVQIKSEDAEGGLFVPQVPVAEAADSRPQPGDGSVGGLADGQPTAGTSSQETEEQPSASPRTSGNTRAPPLFVVDADDADDKLPPLPVYPDAEDVLSSKDMENPFRGRGVDEISGDVKAIGWLNTFGKGKQVILQYGPPNAARYRAVASSLVDTHIVSDDDMNLGKYRPAEEKKEGRYVVKPKTEIFFQGVAWTYPEDHEAPLQLLNPANWRSKGPFTMIRIKFEDPTQGETKEGEEKQWIKSWETRTTVRRILGSAKIRLDRDYTWEGHVIVPKHQVIKKADLAIINAAINCERRRKEFLKGVRLPREKSPTPYPAAEAQRGDAMVDT